MGIVPMAKLADNSGGLVFYRRVFSSFQAVFTFYSLTNTSWLGAITPIGGLAFIAGWGCLIITAFRQ